MPTQSTDHLQSAFRGELIPPITIRRDKADNAMIDKRPRLITRRMDVANVMAAVQFGRENGMPTAVRRGGYNGGGLGICEDGLFIDLSTVSASIPRPTPCVWKEAAFGRTVDHATHAFGMATPRGQVFLFRIERPRDRAFICTAHNPN